MARGVDGRETFSDHLDRRLFLTALAELKRGTSCILFAYCLMGNHFHLAIKVDKIPLSQILQRLLTRYATAFNVRHDRTGHLFQARYKAVLCLNEAYLLCLIDYIHNNPVRSGLVAKAEDWEWSSGGAYLKNRRTELVDPNDLPLTLGLDGDAQKTPGEFDPWPQESLLEPVLLRNPHAERASLESLAMHVSSSTNVSIDIIRSNRRESSIVQAKRTFITSCLREGHTLSDISRWLRCSPSGIHYLAYTRPDLKELKA